MLQTFMTNHLFQIRFADSEQHWHPGWLVTLTFLRETGADSHAALVVFTAVACAWLVFLVSCCVLFDCRQARVAGHHGALGQGCSLPVCATTGLMVQTVQMYVFVQFLNKVGDLPVVGLHGPHSAGARGASTGAVLGRGYGHYDLCRGPDSVNCLEVPQFRSCSSSMVVDIPVFTQRLIPMVLIIQKTIKILQLLVDTVADVPVVRVVQVLTCRLWM